MGEHALCYKNFDGGMGSRSFLLGGWQGTYSAIFLFALQPAVFSENLYFITTFMTLGSLCLGIVYFIDVLFHQCIGASRIQVGIISMLMIAACTQLLPSPVQAFYWYNGSIYYTFFFGISLLFYGKIILFCKLYKEDKLSSQKKCTRILTLALFSVILGGTNYVTALTTAILIVSALVILLMEGEKKIAVPLLLPATCFFVGFAVSVLAPGNAVRQQTYASTRMSPLRAIFWAFVSAGQSIQNWTTLVMVAVVAFSVPALYRMAANSKLAFRYPFLPPIISFCLLSAMYAPPRYAMGYDGPGRLLNIIFYAYVILVFLNVFYLLGALARLIERSGANFRGYSVGFVICMAVFLVLACLFTQRIYTSTSAVTSLANGDAKECHDTHMERCKVYNDESIQDVVVTAYRAKPYVMFWEDVQPDPSDWRNRAVANYYGKSSVILRSD